MRKNNWNLCKQKGQNDKMKNDAESKFMNGWTQILINDKFVRIISNLINMTNDELMPQIEIVIQNEKSSVI